MNALVGSLLAGLLLAAFARPRWWLALAPAAVAIGLTGYRLAVSRGVSSEDAIALVGVVLLAAAMEAALMAGALARAALDRAQGRPARTAARAAGGIALVGVAFLATIVVVAQAPRELFALLSVAAVGVVVARALRARLRGGRVKTPRRPMTAPRASATETRTITPIDRRRARIRRTAPRPSPRRRVSS
jgi:hypothetical protein